MRASLGRCLFHPLRPPAAPHPVPSTPLSLCIYQIRITLSWRELPSSAPERVGTVALRLGLGAGFSDLQLVRTPCAGVRIRLRALHLPWIPAVPAPREQMQPATFIGGVALRSSPQWERLCAPRARTACAHRVHRVHGIPYGCLPKKCGPTSINRPMVQCESRMAA